MQLFLSAVISKKHTVLHSRRVAVYLLSPSGVCWNEILSLCLQQNAHSHPPSLSLTHTHTHTHADTLSIYPSQGQQRLTPFLWLTFLSFDWQQFGFIPRVYMRVRAQCAVKVTATYLWNPPGTCSHNPGPLPILLDALGTHVTPVAYLQMGT